MSGMVSETPMIHITHALQHSNTADRASATPGLRSTSTSSLRSSNFSFFPQAPASRIRPWQYFSEILRYTHPSSHPFPWSTDSYPAKADKTHGTSRITASSTRRCRGGLQMSPSFLRPSSTPTVLAWLRWAPLLPLPCGNTNHGFT